MIIEACNLHPLNEKTRTGKSKVANVGESLFYFCEVVEDNRVPAMH